MTRTTVDIDAPILRELKRLQKRQRRTLGKLVSELLAEALARRRHAGEDESPTVPWSAQAMAARIDYADKEQLWSILDREGRPE